MHTQAVSRTAGADASGQVVVQGLLSRSAVNREFRRKLLSDPRAAVAEFAGVDVAQVREPLELRFVESGGATAAQGAARTIVLPQLVDVATELSDAELE